MCTWKGVHHSVVHQFPLLRIAETHAGIDPAVVEGAAIDQEHHPHARGHAVVQHEAATAHRLRQELDRQQALR
jgi:hypothetical protein